MADPKIYNKIGVGYNQTRKADPYICKRVHDFLATEPGNTYVDVGCGTGNYTVMMSDMGGNFIGIEPSELMLEAAKNKSAKVKWDIGTAEHLPLPDNSVDGAVTTFTIHHWTDVEKGFKEVARVLKPGSRFVIFTCTPEQVRGYWFNHFFPTMVERSIKKAIDPVVFKNAAEKAGFAITETEKYFIQEDLQDRFYYSGKLNPEIYFDPAVRKGMSVFATLLDKDEEDAGLKLLRESLDNGQFEVIRKQYENDKGDCTFIVLTKQ